MNLRILSVLASFAAVLAVPSMSRAAAYTVTLSNVHICCDSCVDDAEKAANPIAGASAEADKDAKTITVTAPDRATAQKAVDALVAAGFYGKSSDPAITVSPETASDAMVSSLKVSGVHLCCKKCVTAVNKAVATVQGVTGTTASKNSDSFEITGNFNAKAVVAALNAAGFSAKAE